jgi:hypothetical protein
LCHKGEAVRTDELFIGIDWVTDADLAHLANLRLRAEAQYSLALLHSPRPLRMAQVSTSEVKCGRAPSLQQKAAAACIFALIRYRRVGAAK